MTHPFLSHEWIQAARAIHERYAGDTNGAGPRIRMNQIITEVPFGDGVIHAFIDSSRGDLLVDLGELVDAEVTVTLDYTTARSMFVDQDAAALMQSFLAGKIRIQGDMTKLLALQAHGLGDTAQNIAAEVKAITA